jgi:ubiquinone/menaquinone biosynthesis C-methylase UbiE
MSGPVRKIEPSEATRIADRLRSVSGGRILDVATGEGGFIDLLMKTLKDYDSFVGIDSYPSGSEERAMEAAMNAYRDKPVRFIRMDAEAMGFEDGSFDTVCISNSLHHLKDVDSVLAEMMRVARPRGNFILQEVYCDGDQTEAQRTEELQHEWEARVDTLTGITHNKSFTRARVIEAVHSLNLSETEVFDSSYQVDCLFCPKRRECEDPRRQAALHDSLGAVGETLERIRGLPDRRARVRLTAEGRKVKSAIARHGIAASSYIFVVGRT